MEAASQSAIDVHPSHLKPMKASTHHIARRAARQAARGSLAIALLLTGCVKLGELGFAAVVE